MKINCHYMVRCYPGDQFPWIIRLVKIGHSTRANSCDSLVHALHRNYPKLMKRAIGQHDCWVRMCHADEKQLA